MKVPVSWLREFVDVSASPEEIAKTMSVRGFAVEGLEQVGDGDAVIDFEVTGNRPDCMSIAGMAREIATAYELSMRPPNIPVASLKTVEKGDVDVVIENADLCPRYAGAVADVTVGPSPAWLQARLKAAGVRPISNIVDVTNYVLLETGQPMHAFDFTKLTGAQIRVRNAKAGESIKTLDGQLRELSTDMLVIADADRPVAVAGVMGGADSEVAAGTSVIVLESAYFNPLSVRRTSRKLALKTEASMRFERGSDPQLPVTAMERACALLEAIGAGRARGTVVDRYPAPAAPRTLRLRRQRITGLLGLEVPDANVTRILEHLGFILRPAISKGERTSVAASADGWEVTVPTRRVDITREVDLIEEIARHYGFDRLPSSFPALTVAPPPVDPRIRRARDLRGVMTGAGFSEAMTFGFVAAAAAAPFAHTGELVPIANPLSENFAVLRPSPLPGLIDAVAHNRRREQRDIRLFEIGARFSKTQGEHRCLACAWTGAAASEHWSGGTRDVDFFDVKGIVERVAEVFQLDVRTEVHSETWLVRGRSAAIVTDAARLGVVGQLAPGIAEAHGLPVQDPVYVAEIDLDLAEIAAPKDEGRVEPLPRYPSVTRDISILVDESVPAAAVRHTVAEAAPSTLVDVREFDRYQGKGVPDGKISLSLRFTFRASDRTLTDAEVQSAMDALIAALRDRHAAIQR